MDKSILQPGIALVAILSASCQEITTAPEGSPRMEMEVAVAVQESSLSGLEGVNAKDFTTVATDVVVNRSDLGMRFYPVLSKDYARKDQRPEYLMTVDVKELIVGLEHTTVNQKEGDPIVVTSVKQIDCVVSAKLVKRRDSGPDLTVGVAEGKGAARVRPDPEVVAEVSYVVKREAPEEGEAPEPLNVSRADLLAAMDSAVAAAYRGLVAAVDREISAGTGPPAESK